SDTRKYADDTCGERYPPGLYTVQEIGCPESERDEQHEREATLCASDWTERGVFLNRIHVFAHESAYEQYDHCAFENAHHRKLHHEVLGIRDVQVIKAIRGPREHEIRRVRGQHGRAALISAHHRRERDAV